MRIKLLGENPAAWSLQFKLRKYLEATRFHIPHITTRAYPRAGPRYKGGDIDLETVRLKEPKFYHGGISFHYRDRPYTMKRRGWGRGEPRACKVSFLEGADWVEFNDIINDFLDQEQISADVASTILIRKGFARRIEYGVAMEKSIHSVRPCWTWERNPDDEQFKKCIDEVVVPFSTFPEETPGIYRGIYRYLVNEET